MRHDVRHVSRAASALAMGLFLLAGTEAYLSRAEAEKPPAAEVKLDNFSFGPADLTVTAGTTVTWTNKDEVPHTVVSDDKLFKSSPIDTDEKYAHKFETPGTYKYFCSLHPKMTGTIVVK